MATIKQLRAVAEEMVDVMNLQDNEGEPLAIDKKATEQDLTAFIKKAVDMIDGDEFSTETQDVIDEIMSGKPEKSLTKAGKKPSKKEPEPEPEDEDEPDSLLEEIKNSSSLKELITIAKDNDEFKSLAKKLATYKKVDALRTDMLAILEAEPEPKEPEFEESPKPKANSKLTKKEPVAEPEPVTKKGKESKDTDTSKKPRGFQKQVGKKRSTIFAEALKKATKKPISIDTILQMMSAEYKGSANVSKFYIKTMIDYLSELELIEVSNVGILYKN
jgi:hypothetical protein